MEDRTQAQTEPQTKTFGEALKEARQHRELGPTDLAVKMNRPKTYSNYIHSIEENRLNPAVTIIAQLAQTLHIAFCCTPEGWTWEET